MTTDPRRLAGAALAAAMRDSRAITLERTADGNSEGDDTWQVPQRAGVNPIAWELGHLAWFAEFWILRGPHALNAQGFVDAAQPPRIAGPDAVFDSARLAHAERWRTPMPSRSELIARLATQLDACIDAIPADANDDAAHYFHRLALFHEDMHGEAFTWLRAALGWPAPAGLEALQPLARSEPIEIAGGDTTIGRARHAAGFSFDNEQPAKRVRVDAFEVDSAPVTAGQFLGFVEAGGYGDPRFWPGPAGIWRASHAAPHPGRWRRAANGEWQTRGFDRWLPFDRDTAVIHVNAWEAEAYCRWSGRRLPSAAEWEIAAADPRFRWGRSVWEWTATAFEPYPGFEPGPYRDYSNPWFGDHRELRGGSFATHARLHHASYRNFFMPGRADVFAGFRCASKTSPTRKTT